MFFFKVSLVSRLADLVGRTLIGTPSQILFSDDERQRYIEAGHAVPAADNFYLMEGDRVMPSPGDHTWRVKRWMVFENQMRMHLSKWVGLYAGLLAIVGTAIYASNSRWLQVAAALGVIALGAYAFWRKDKFKGLANIMPLQKMRTASWAEVNAVSRRWDVPHGKDTTPDLDDVEGRWDLTPEGFRVSGRVLPEDMLHGTYSSVVPLLIGLLPWMLVVNTGMYRLSTILGLVFTLATMVYLLALIRSVGFMLSIVLIAGAVLAMKMVGNVVASLMSADNAAVFNNMTGITLYGARSGETLAQWVIFALLPLAFVFIKSYGRARDLAAQGREANAASTGKLRTVHVEARRRQAIMAKKDRTDFILLGKSMGVFTQKRDGYAPDAGKPFGLTIQDLSLHFMVLGTTNAGKTWTVLARLARSILRSETKKVGALFIDNKGALPYDMKGIRDDYVVLSPEDDDVGLLEGLTGEERASAILAVVAPESMGNQSSNDAYFNNIGSVHLRHGFVFHAALAQWDAQTFKMGVEKYTPEELEDLPEDERPVRSWKDNMYTCMEIIDMMNEPIPEGQDNNTLAAMAGEMMSTLTEAQRPGLLNDACKYIRSFPLMDPKARDNAHNQVQSWLAPLRTSAKMYRWLHCETGFDVSSVCSGAAVGLNTPPHRYKKAGLIAANMIKERIYSIVRNRPEKKDWVEGDGWTEVVLMIDECQETISKSEDTMFAVARSKGLIGIFAAQSKEAIVEKMGEKSADAFLGNIHSRATLAATPGTYKYMQEMLGYTENVLYHAPAKGLDYNYSSQLTLSAPHYDPTHPNAGMMKSFIRKGGSVWERLAKNALSGFAQIGKNTAVTNVERKMEPLVDMAEIGNYLRTTFMMLIEVKRGGVVRRDFVQGSLIDVKTGKDIEVFEEDKQAVVSEQ